MVPDEIWRHRLMWLRTEEISMMQGHREDNPREEDQDQDKDHEDEAGGHPSDNEPEATGNTEIGVDHCEQLGPHCRRPDEEGFGHLHDSTGSTRTAAEEGLCDCWHHRHIEDEGDEHGDHSVQVRDPHRE